MSTEIYYFSGTGNSLFVARELQKRIPDSKIIPIVSLIEQKVIQTKGSTVGFVFPVHALTIPIADKEDDSALFLSRPRRFKDGNNPAFRNKVRS